MFPAELGYARMQRKSRDKGVKELALNEQRSWRFYEEGPASGIGLMPHSVYAQNEIFIDFCNPAWDFSWKAVFGSFFIISGILFLGWLWCDSIVFKGLLRGGGWSEILFGWLFLFPCLILMLLLGYGWFEGMGMRTAFFTYARGRIRFNRKTRKVYILRPNYCGGYKVFEWERLVSLFRRVPEDHPMAQKINGALVLYHPPFQEDDPQGTGEDAIFVGPTLGEGEVGVNRAAMLWEYIRRYMEEGPSVDRIPLNAPSDYKKIPRILPSIYTTYCGLPSARQYQLEMHPGFGETVCHMISQVTCSWVKFPKEWQSDSGLGEPEDRPVQTGAVMTALVYRAEGKLSKEDEIEFLTHWGTEEALAEAKAR